MKDVPTFSARFRFRVQRKLNIKEHEYRFNVGEHEVVICSQSCMAINQSEWLVMNAKGFNLENDARDFARKLKAATEISSVATRLGIDSGIDAPTLAFGSFIKDRYREHGLTIRGDIHGVDVFPDDPEVRIPYADQPRLSVPAEPDPFLSDLPMLFDAAENLSQNTKDIILLLNYALMRPEPVAQIVFVISAVEKLGQQEKWSADQKCLLEKLASNAETDTIGTAEERREVSDAIKRRLHKIGLRQGVLRLLDRVDLSHLKKEWETVYKQRSTLVHGLAPKPGADYTGLAAKTVSLCGKLLLKVIAKEVPTANSHVDKFYAT
jgi:hypothetical protein